MRIPCAKIGLSLALIVSSCSNPEPGKEAKLAPIPVDLLQDLATKECNCRLAGKPSAILQSDFEALSVDFQSIGSATSSLPVSYENVCFTQLEEEACVFKGAYVPPDASDFVCTLEQADELEKAWGDVGIGPDGSTTAADLALQNRLAEIRSEAKAKIGPNDCPQ